MAITKQRNRRPRKILAVAVNTTILTVTMKGQTVTRKVRHLVYFVNKTV